MAKDSMKVIMIILLTFLIRLVFRRSQQHITAEVFSSDSIVPVLSCSTKEWAVKQQLGSTRSVAACRAVGEVLAQRCLEAGLTRIVYREVPWKFRSEAVSRYNSPFHFFKCVLP